MTSNREDDELSEIDPAVLQGLARVVPQIDPSPALRARVLQSIGSPRRDRLDAAGDASRRAPQESRGLAWWLVTAASVALAAGLAIYTSGLRSRIGALESELSEARALVNAGQLRVADVERAANVAQTSVAVLTAPDVARIDLAGQAAAPDASARAFWSRSRGMVFTGTNLPQLPAGRTYQVWVVTAQAPVSAGLLRPDAQGSVSGTFATPPDIAPPTAVAITIEPDGGVPAPTGDMYLMGKVVPGSPT